MWILAFLACLAVIVLLLPNNERSREGFYPGSPPVNGDYVAKIGKDGYVYYVPKVNSGAGTVAKLEVHRARMERLVNEAWRKWGAKSSAVHGLRYLLYAPLVNGRRVSRITAKSQDCTTCGGATVPGTDPWIHIGNLALDNYLDLIHEMAHQAYGWNGACQKNTCENDNCHTPTFYTIQRNLMYLAAEKNIMPKNTPHNQPYDPWHYDTYKALIAGRYYRKTGPNGQCV